MNQSHMIKTPSQQMNSSSNQKPYGGGQSSQKRINQLLGIKSKNVVQTKINFAKSTGDLEKDDRFGLIKTLFNPENQNSTDSQSFQFNKMHIKEEIIIMDLDQKDINLEEDLMPKEREIKSQQSACQNENYKNTDQQLIENQVEINIDQQQNSPLIRDDNPYYQNSQEHQIELEEQRQQVIFGYQNNDKQIEIQDVNMTESDINIDENDINYDQEQSFIPNQIIEQSIIPQQNESEIQSMVQNLYEVSEIQNLPQLIEIDKTSEISPKDKTMIDDQDIIQPQMHLNSKPLMVDACIQYEDNEKEYQNLDDESIESIELQNENIIQMSFTNKLTTTVDFKESLTKTDEEQSKSLQILEHQKQPYQQQILQIDNEDKLNQQEEEEASESFVLFEPEIQKKNPELLKFYKLTGLAETQTEIDLKLFVELKLEENQQEAQIIINEPNHKKKRDLKSLLKQQQKQDKVGRNNHSRHVKFDVSERESEDDKISFSKQLKLAKKQKRVEEMKQEFVRALGSYGNDTQEKDQSDEEEIEEQIRERLLEQKSSQKQNFIYKSRKDGLMTPTKKMVDQKKRNLNTSFYQSQSLFGNKYYYLDQEYQNFDE
ncbi:UNKNOWN [Stylonychia lemnae]|uniref:Uncharacterized protein n=1 Tax=Stylonychia lemnae TaxID=5949 RepID=A0A078A991_STYLE|nr:UNKNOWN [Stylonychia lemnae]|eukprot:CDW78411.1 UNKNOWN [Stylonychia lemnae]